MLTDGRPRPDPGRAAMKRGSPPVATAAIRSTAQGTQPLEEDTQVDLGALRVAVSAGTYGVLDAAEQTAYVGGLDVRPGARSTAPPTARGG